MSLFIDYHKDVRKMAEDIVDANIEELLTEAREGYDFIETLQDKVHETLDSSYNFAYGTVVDFSRIIASSENVVDDSGLWEGQSPEDAILTMAFFTMRNDVELTCFELLKEPLELELEHYQEQLRELKDMVYALEDNSQQPSAELEEKIEDIQQVVWELERAVKDLK